LSLRLLVVDDDADALVALSDALRLNISDATVALASSAEDALTVLSSQAFDVILSDVRMPRMSGIDLLRQVKAEHPDCIMFLMTGCEGQARPEAMHLGAAQLLEKPIDIKRLSFLVKQAVDHAKLLHALRERNRQSQQQE
jgi:two-component system, NtrC family, response regulator HydG